MKIQLKRSSVLDGGSAKAPEANQMEYGELAVNYNNAEPTIFLKTSTNEIVTIAGGPGPASATLQTVTTAGNFTTTSVLIGSASADPNLTLDSTGLINTKSFVRSSRTSSTDVTFEGQLSGTITSKLNAQGGLALGGTIDSTTTQTGANIFLSGDTGTGRFSGLTTHEAGVNVTGGIGYFAGNVGIGTDDPDYSLQVSSNNTANVSIETRGDNSSARVARLIYTFSDGDGASINGVRKASETASDAGLSFRTGGITNTNERMLIDSNGNVGIGTANPQGKLELKSPTGTSCDLLINEGTTSNPLAISQNATEARIQTTAAQPVVIAGQGGSGSTSRLVFETRGSERMTVSADGNVGIGTDSPTQGKLCIELATQGDTPIYVNTLTTGVGTINPIVEAQGQNAAALARMNFLRGSNSTYGGITFDTSDVSGTEERMRIDTDGKVGIGTDSPTSTLTVVDELGAGIRSQSKFNQSTDTNKALSVSNGDTTDTFNVSYGGQGYFAGNVGIGTDDPNYELQLSSSNKTNLSIESRGDNSISRLVRLIYSFNDGDGASIGGVRKASEAVGDVSLSFRTGGITDSNEKMLIDSNGNVGIGSNNPLQKLEVSGNTSLIGGGQLLLQDDARVQWGTSDTAYISGKEGASGYLKLGAGGDRINILSNGNVGIAEDSPQQKLDVNGSILSQNYFLGVAAGTYGILNDTSIEMYGAASSQEMVFKVNGPNARMRINSSGNVGIGTDSPQSRLTIGSSTNANNYISFGSRVTANESNKPLIGQTTNDGVTNDLGICTTSSNGSIRFFTGNGAAGFGDGSNTERMRVSAAGKVGIGITDPTQKLHVSGSGLFTSNVTAYSDVRLKNNIETIPNALDKVMALRGVGYNRIDLEDKPRHIGVIAQELEKVIPEVVTTEKDGIKSVAYGNLVGLLIESIKELKAEVNELKAQLED